VPRRRRTGAAANCAASARNGLAALNPAEMARLQAFLPRPLRTMELKGNVLDTMLDLTFGAHKLTVGGQYNDTDMIDGVFGAVRRGQLVADRHPDRHGRRAL